MIAALFVETNGVYFGLPDVDPWDIERDARKFDGADPVVAHPPCGPWSHLRHLCRKQDPESFGFALRAVRANGGVLEHPSGSTAFRAHGVPLPGDPPDAFGGQTFSVCQVEWGHVARKRTWLYVVGATPDLIPPFPGREPTHWVSGGRSRNRKGGGGIAPAGIRFCSSHLRRATPIAFRDFLLDIARSVRRAA